MLQDWLLLTQFVRLSGQWQLSLACIVSTYRLQSQLDTSNLLFNSISCQADFADFSQAYRRLIGAEPFGTHQASHLKAVAFARHVFRFCIRFSLYAGSFRFPSTTSSAT